MEVEKAIRERRSVRTYRSQEVKEETVRRILDAGRWAPSGLNNQPWKFLVLEKACKDSLAEYTKYGEVIRSSARVILVFLDREESYHYEKDLLAVGACVQNMLLEIHSCRLGGCWLGEILNRREAVHAKLEIPGHLQLEAVIAVGVPGGGTQAGVRKELGALWIGK
ncbi:MAG: nitroreductase family protein [Candidatus Omnitrophica bacterium]|nr:nitroreductase family protein [Candidatus Omnitrophota bacterium]